MMKKLQKMKQRRLKKIFFWLFLKSINKESQLNEIHLKK